jgi:ribosomal protein L37AE/L43A
MSENKLENITKVKMRCLNCNTVVIAEIGKSIEQCPACQKTLNGTRAFAMLEEAFKEFGRYTNFEFGLICEESDNAR